jgi:hypothetical protein
MNYKTIATVAVAVVLSIAGAYFLLPKDSPVVGALTSPDLPWSYLCWGGGCVMKSSGTCASGTSTAFAMVNPWSATSTASIVMTITGQATSTDLEVGTTTRDTGLTAAVVSNRLIDDITVATSTQTAVASGIDAGGYHSPGTLSSARVVVKPGEYLGAFATSTYANELTVNYSAGLTCGYVVEWERMF